MKQTAAFELIGPENSVAITLNDNVGRVAPEEWIIGTDPRMVGWAIFCFAKTHSIRLNDVGYSIRGVKVK